MRMSFEWAEFLELAEGLYGSPDSPGPEEAALRSAASRAYYAALHCALRFAQEEGFRCSPSLSIHQELPKYFRGNAFGNKEREDRGKIAIELDRLRHRRQEADYEDTLRRSADAQAYFAIGSAQRVLATLRTLSEH
jgi:uncharacterized protein (UPF0332 family)